MKKERSKNKLTKEDYDKFPYEDTRHYGLFYSKSGDEFKVKIDPKRFCYSLNIQFIEPVMNIINSRKTHYFYPRKSKYHDYNSMSTFEKLYSSYPELLPADVDYEQGVPAYSVIKFSDNLIIELLDGCSSFFKEYCKLVFDEDYDEAQWNNGDFFYEHVRDFINMYINPLNLPYYL